MRVVEVSGHIFPYQTGRFPRVSSRANMSVMVLYNYNSKTILNKTLKNHTTQELVMVQTRIIRYLLDRGLKQSAFHIDNECPKALLSFFRANSVNVHICPPNDHHKTRTKRQ